MRRAALAALFLAVLAACGSSSASLKNAPTSTEAATSTSLAHLPPPSSGVRRIQPTPGALDVHPVTFDPSRATARDDAVLVHFSGGIAPCFVVDHYAVTETASTVTITVYAGRDAKKRDTVCAA